MDITRVTLDQLDGLSEADLSEVRAKTAYNAAIIENRGVVSDSAHRMARHLRALNHAARRVMAQRETVKKVRRNIPSLEGFITFAEGHPPDRPYNWIDCDTCLVAAYARSLGLVYADISRLPIPAPPGWSLDEPFTLDYLALMAQPHTYGAAAGFARVLTGAGIDAALADGGSEL